MRKLKLFFACLLMAVLSIGQMWGETYTLGWGTASGTAGTYTNFTDVSGSVTNVVSFASDKGSSSTNPAYNSNSSELRLYYNSGGNGGYVTLTPASGVTITGFVMTTSTAPSVKYTVDGGTATSVSASSNTYTVTGISATSSLKIQNVNTSNTQLRIKTIQITYSVSGTAKPTVSLDPDGGNFTESVEVTITPSTGATAYYTTDATKKTSPSTTTWTAYNGSAKPTFTETTTIWVAAVKDATWSDVVEKTFTKVTPVTSYDIDFETNDLSLYVNWDFTNIGIRSTIARHGGDYYGANVNSGGNGTATCSITTKSKIAAPGTLTFYISKESGNTTASSWKAEVSSDGSDWTEVETFDAKSMSSGTWNECIADLSAYSDVYVRISYGSSSAIRTIDDISLVMASGIAKPTITGEDNFLTSTEATMSCTTDGAAIYYTTTESAKATPATSGDWNAYDNSNKPSFSATTTVWAAAKKNDAWSAVAEKTFTKATVLTVAEALTIIEGLDNKTATTAEYYVSGVVSTVTALTVDGTGEYYISADGTKTSELQVYKGKWVGGANFTSTDQLIEGDDVTIKGKLKKYNDYKELDQNNEVVLYKLKARLAWAGTTEGVYDASLEGANTFPTLTNTNGVDVEYSSSNGSAATINPSTGAISLVAVGSTTITAAFTGNETYKANSVSYTLNVASSVVHATISFDVDGGDAIAALTDRSALPSELPVATKAGKNFGGWFTDPEKTVDAVAGAAITENTTLYAKWLDPYTVAEAKTVIDANPDGIANQYVAGIISQIDSYNNTYKSITYWISADGTTTNQLQVYSGLIGNAATALGKDDFSAKEDLELGDEVVVTGTLKLHNSTTYEFDKNNTIYSFNRPEVAVSSVELDQNAASIEVNETVTLHATVNPDNASDKSITWSVQSGSTYASVENGVVTGLVAGEAVIRAASTTDPTKFAECTVTVTAADPTKHVVTFDATVDKGESPLSKSNITFTCSNGVLNNGTEYRLYKSSTTTFECSAGNITKIEFTGVSNNPVSGFGDPEVGSLVTEGKDGVWTGNAASVTFTASGAQVRATEIKVTYKEDNRSAAGLAWSSEAVVLTVGSEFTAPTLTNPNNIAAGEITIASGNTALAVVNDGVVSLVENAIGEATITATFNGNDNYKPATVSYTITVNEAGLDNITFDATTDIAGTNELSITKAGFTLAFTDGAMGNGSEYRLYKGQTMTLSSADYKIKKIEFTCTTGNPIIGFANAEGLDKENDQWTGEANSVELTASGAQVRITKLKVFYIEDTRENAGIAYETTEYDATINGTFTTPTLTNSNNLTVIYSSSDQNLALVDENSGDVTIGAAEGTVTITATFAGNDTYKPGTASYTINIIDPTPVILVSPASANFGTVNQNAEVAAKTINVTLKNVANAIVTLAGEGAGVFSIDPESLTESGTITVSVTNTAVEGTYEATVTISDASQEENAAEPKVVNISMTVQNKTNRRWYMAYQPKVGMQVIIAGKANNSEDWKAMGAQNTNNRAAVANSVEEGVLEPAEGTETFTLISAGYDEDDNQLYAIKTSDGDYLYAASSSANQLKTQTTLTDNGKWKITINDEGIATIKAQGTSTRNWMQYNSGSSLFACYSGAQQNIYLYTNHKQSPSSNTSQSIADITGSDTEEASATKVYVPAGKTLAVATTDPAIPELVVEAKKDVSTQIMNPERITTPDFYLDYQLCDGALDADYWYCIAVPFNVDINMGIYKTDGTKLTNHVDYEVWGYDTEKRAETMSNGWTRLNGGMMQAGHAYLIGFNDGMDNMVRLKAAADWKANLYNLDYLALTAASNGADALGKHSNWNALGNPTTQYKSLNSANVSNVQIFDNNAHTFSTFDLATANFVVGRPFFIQYGSNIAIEDEKAGGEFRAPKRQSEKMYYEVQIARIGKKYFDNQIIVRASEDATNTYEQGHDVITMNDATSKNAALLWTKNYGDMRLAAEEAPLTEGVATYSLGIFAPANGTYTISVAAPKENADLYLTYEGSIIWNLSASEYTIDLTKGATNGYGLVMKAKAPQVGTGIESQAAIVNGVEKVVINNTIYILRDQQMYDLTGKMVK